MPKRYQKRRRSPSSRSRRSILMQPDVQLAVLLITALVIYLILKSAGG